MAPCGPPDDDRDLLRLLGPDDVAALLRDAVPDDLDAGELILGLDRASYLCGIASRFPERGGPVPELCAEHLCLVSAELRARELVLVTFVAATRIVPTAGDVARLEGLRVECRAQHVDLLDHLLVSGRRWRSIAELTPIRGDGPFSPSDGDHAA